MTNQQLSVATMGKIDKNRYEDNFGLDIMFIQQRIVGDTRLVGIGSISKYDGEGTGG